MVSWRDHMPEGMLLKSTPAAWNLDCPQPRHTLADYCDAAGIRRLVADEDIIPVETFIAYGEWFQHKPVPGLEQVRVVSVDRDRSDGFEPELDSGEMFTAPLPTVAAPLTGGPGGSPLPPPGGHRATTRRSPGHRADLGHQLGLSST